MKSTPPHIALKFLRWFCREDYLDELEGDLVEVFKHQFDQSPNRAKWKFIWSVLRHFRPDFIKVFNIGQNSTTMVQHNLKIAYRTFLKHKSSFIINLIGLTSGLACSLLIYLWVLDEMAMDQFHEKDKRLYQVFERREHNGEVGAQRSTPWLLAETLKEEMPEVEYSAVVAPANWFPKFTLKANDKATKADGQYVGADFFNVFSFNIIHGNKNEVLKDKNSIVISEELALKLFSTSSEALGQNILFQQETEYKVAGVFENIGSNSSLQFEFVLPIDLLKDMQPQASDWKNAGPHTFVVLQEGSDPNAFNKKITSIISDRTEAKHRTPFLTVFSSNYLYGDYENGVQSGGRIEYVQLFSLIAVFILIIACINFMNLATAQASRRIKEVGVKKAMGVSRKLLIVQYITESTLLVFLALITSLLFVGLLLPQFNLITGKELSLLFDVELVLSITLITLATGILAGSYPAFYLSKFRPATVLKGKLNKNVAELWVRKGLVIFQFTLSVIFIASIVIIYKQIEFIQTKSIGYNKENIIHFEVEGAIGENLETFINELEKVPGVAGASSAGQSMVGGGNTSNIGWEGKDPELISNIAFRPVNYGLIELLDIEVVEGRSFSKDYNDELTVVFNETGIETMSLENPIGKSIEWGGMELKIIGVIKDFHFESLRTQVNPMFFILAPQYTQKVMVRIEGGKLTQTLAALEEFYRQYNPGFVLDYTFLNDEYRNQYISEERVSQLSKYFGGIAIIISCLGLFGLVAFSAERRNKEIGIRKVLGSSVTHIIYLLSRDFSLMVTIAILIALPISYYLANSWLNNFAFKINLNWWIFAGSGLLALMVAWLTVGLQTIKTANLNPVDCLKDE